MFPFSQFICSLQDYEDPLAVFESIDNKKPGGKRLSVERIYQKKTQLEHILLRPDTYIGSVERTDPVVCAYFSFLLIVLF